MPTQQAVADRDTARSVRSLSLVSKPGVPCAVDRGVLIVEDNDDLRQMLTDLLAFEGFRTHAVANGREALDYLQDGNHPGLILLDLMMPVMDGWEFRREQQRDSDFADVPVVVLSALNEARAAEIGCAEYLRKPIDFDRLFDVVRHYCH